MIAWLRGLLRCGSRWGTYRCDRQRLHAGAHGSLLDMTSWHGNPKKWR